MSYIPLIFNNFYGFLAFVDLDVKNRQVDKAFYSGEIEPLWQIWRCPEVINGEKPAVARVGSCF